MSVVFWVVIVPLGVVYCAALWKDYQVNQKIKTVVERWTGEK